MDNDLQVFKDSLVSLSLKDLDKQRDDLRTLKSELYHRIDLLVIKINMANDEIDKRRSKINGLYY